MGGNFPWKDISPAILSVFVMMMQLCGKPSDHIAHIGQSQQFCGSSEMSRLCQLYSIWICKADTGRVVNRAAAEMLCLSVSDACSASNLLHMRHVGLKSSWPDPLQSFVQVCFTRCSLSSHLQLFAYLLLLLVALGPCCRLCRHTLPWECRRAMSLLNVRMCFGTGREACIRRWSLSYVCGHHIQSPDRTCSENAF